MSESELRHHLDEGTVYRVGPKRKGWTLEAFLQERIPRLSLEKIHEMIRSRVRLSWVESAQPETLVRVGGGVHVGFPAIDEKEIVCKIPVLYEDDLLLAVDKPAGLLVHPTSYCRRNAISRMLERKLGRRLYLVHRLDRDTTGVFLLAKSKEAAQRLSMDFKLRRVEKEYLAVVRGSVRKDRGSIDRSLGQTYYTTKGIRRNAVEDGDGGKEALTEFRVERRFADRTLLRLFPKTGRTHQIRVHLAAMGFPILGDRLYDNEPSSVPRLHLHARALIVEHPGSGTKLRLEAPIPDYFSAGSD